MNADIPFESAKLLIARAKENFVEFETRYKAFLAERPYTTVTEDEPGTPNKILKLKLTKALPIILRAVYSDGLNNMRHALDHAVNDAAVLLRGGSRNCYFPFGKNAAEFGLIYESKRYKTVPVALRPHLNGLQPYFGGNEILYALGKLSGPNKHQIVLRLSAATTNELHNVRVEGTGFGLLMPRWDDAKGEMPLYVLYPGGHVKTDVSFTPQITCDEPAVRGLKTAAGLSDEFMAMTESVVSGLEAETERLQREGDNGHDAAASGV